MSLLRPLAIALGRMVRVSTSDTLDLSNPPNPQSGTTYTFALTDAFAPVVTSNSSAVTVTVPANGTVAFPLGTELEVEQGGAGQVTLAAGVGVTINSASGNLSISAQGGKVKLRKTGTNTWYASGDLSITSNVIARDATELSVSNNSGAQTAFSFSVPANKLGTDKTLAIELGGDIAFNSGSPTWTISVAYGGTTLWSETSSAFAGSANRHPWYLTLRLSEHAGVTNSQVLTGHVIMSSADAAVTGEGGFNAIIATTSGFNTGVYGTASVDSTSAQTLTITFTMSVANAANNWKRENAIAYMLGEATKGDTGAQGIQGVGQSSITFNEQSGTTYTLVLGDKGQCVNCSNASAIAVTVPTNASVAFSVGDVIYIRQGGAGAVTVSGAGGVTLQYPYSNITGAQYAWLAITYKGSDVWALSGQSL